MHHLGSTCGSNCLNLHHHVFGDTYAPMMFDRFHHVILVAFVITVNNIPSCVWGKRIDVPKEKRIWIERHFQAYRLVCDRLGVQLSPVDNSMKSFEASQVGEVLGIQWCLY